MKRFLRGLLGRIPPRELCQVLLEVLEAQLKVPPGVRLVGIVHPTTVVHLSAGREDRRAVEATLVRLYLDDEVVEGWTREDVLDCAGYLHREAQRRLDAWYERERGAPQGDPFARWEIPHRAPVPEEAYRSALDRATRVRWILVAASLAGLALLAGLLVLALLLIR